MHNKKKNNVKHFKNASCGSQILFKNRLENDIEARIIKVSKLQFLQQTKNQNMGGGGAIKKEIEPQCHQPALSASCAW